VRHLDIEKKNVIDILAELRPRRGGTAGDIDRGARRREINARELAKEGIIVHDENSDGLVKDERPRD
jgi:hypothetical protein